MLCSDLFALSNHFFAASRIDSSRIGSNTACKLLSPTYTRSTSMTTGLHCCDTLQPPLSQFVRPSFVCRELSATKRKLPSFTAYRISQHRYRSQMKLRSVHHFVMQFVIAGLFYHTEIVGIELIQSGHQFFSQIWFAARWGVSSSRLDLIQ